METNIYRRDLGGRGAHTHLLIADFRCRREKPALDAHRDMLKLDVDVVGWEPVRGG